MKIKLLRAWSHRVVGSHTNERWLFRLPREVSFDDPIYHGDGTVTKVATRYVVGSHYNPNDHMGGKDLGLLPEILVFPCNRNGKILSFREVVGGKSVTLNWIVTQIEDMLEEWD